MWTKLPHIPQKVECDTKHPIYGNGVAKGCFTSLCDKLFYFVRSQTIFSDLNFHTLLYQLTLGANFFDQECIDDYLLHG